MKLSVQACVHPLDFPDARTRRQAPVFIAEGIFELRLLGVEAFQDHVDRPAVADDGGGLRLHGGQLGGEPFPDAPHEAVVGLLAGFALAQGGCGAHGQRGQARLQRGERLQRAREVAGPKLLDDPISKLVGDPVGLLLTQRAQAGAGRQVVVGGHGGQGVADEVEGAHAWGLGRPRFLWNQVT